MTYIDPTEAQFAVFEHTEREGPLHMLNLVRLRAEAQYPDGRRATGAEAYRAYTRESGPVFTRVGAKLHWVGRFECTLIGPPDERWDAVFIAAYPNLAAFLEMVRDPAYREAVKHRQAAAEDSRLIRLEPRKISRTNGGARADGARCGRVWVAARPGRAVRRDRSVCRG